MPRAIPLATRQDIIDRHVRGQALTEIAAELKIPYVTVRSIWRAFRDQGADGLVVGYHACGGSTPAYPDAVLRRACRIKREHPGWGAGRIRVELLESLSADAIPSTRVLQRAFRRAGINKPRRSQRPSAIPRPASAPHELWQVDAVEKARLRNRVEVSWLSVTDVFTGGMLANELSPPGTMAIGHAQPGSNTLPQGVSALGVARANPGRQWTSLGSEQGTAARLGVVVDWARYSAALDPARPTASQWHDRTRQRGHETVGRTRDVPRPRRVAEPSGAGVPNPARAVSRDRGDDADRSLPGIEAFRATLRSQAGDSHVGTVAGRPVSIHGSVLPSGERSRCDLALRPRPQLGAESSRQRSERAFRPQFTTVGGQRS
jgi:hypothetical protein